MNERAANALYEAERSGVRQIINAPSDASGGRCAGGVIAEALFGTTWVPNCWPIVLHAAGMDADEWGRMVELNNVERLTFAEIARKLGPDAA